MLHCSTPKGRAGLSDPATQTLGHETAFYWYVTAMMVMAYFVRLRLPRQAKYLRHEH
ncbi:hypothetical protein [Cupriavidus necator]